MTSQSAGGTFYGYDAEGVGGSFGATFEETFHRGENYFEDVDSEEVTIDRTVVGIFEVNN